MSIGLKRGLPKTKSSALSSMPAYLSSRTLLDNSDLKVLIAVLNAVIAQEVAFTNKTTPETTTVMFQTTNAQFLAKCQIAVTKASFAQRNMATPM